LFGFGVPRRVATLAGPLIPISELATAAALVIAPSAQWGGVAALALLLAFLGGIAHALARGEAPDCHCFGIFHSSRAGPGAIYRNAALAVVAGFVAVQGPGPSLTGWISDHRAGDVLAAVFGAIALLSSAAALRTYRENRRLSGREEYLFGLLSRLPPGLPTGAVAPDFDVPAVGGGRLTLRELTADGLPLLLVFMEPGCLPCQELAPGLARWQGALGEHFTIALIGRGDADHEEYARYGVRRIGMQEDLEVSNAYWVRGMPSALFIAPDGRIASPMAQGANAIESMIRLRLRRDAGEPAPTAATSR
jgi:hypothetical protein